MFVIAIFHTVSHILFYGTGVSGAIKSGISGLSIGGLLIDDTIKQRYSGYSKGSLLILAMEWVFLAMISVSAFIRHKQEMHEDIKNNFNIQRYKAGTKTDLDVLHDILKEKKHLRISTIAKIFNVKKEIAMNWARTFEAANIATIEYPRVGEPELT